ncbi:MAG: hypothetical protein E7677_00515 [Ruminococcaceae bacterium]|nr:hypothetical protein [Oscillospiraceae bacterium]
MIHPLLFLVGYKIVSVPEKNGVDFVNFCAQNGCRYHSMGKRQTDGGERLFFRMHIISASRAHLLRERHGVDIKTESTHGIPFLALGALKRPGLLLGLAVFFFLTLASGRVIWDVRIEGNERVSDSEIIALLKESGMGVGDTLADIDVDGTETRFLIASDEISWIAINISGTVADVEVREVEPVVPKTDDGVIASNLVCSKNGVIVGFEEVRGNIVVAIGDAVSEGDLLVGGVYGTADTPLRVTRSRGKVFALCDNRYEIKVPLAYTQKTYTGRKKVKKTLIFFEKEVKFFENSRNLYTTYDTIRREEYLDPFGLGKLPIGIRTVEYTEYVEVDALRTEDEALAEANFLLWQRVYGENPDATLETKRLTGRLEGDVYVLDAAIRTVENVAVERVIEVELTSISDYKNKRGADKEWKNTQGR